MHTGARTAVKTVIVAAVLCFSVAYHVWRFPVMKNGIDFPAFYCAAKMVLFGAGSQLYDIAAEQRFQAQYTGRVGVIFNHPPYETLMYLPAALLSYARGYLLWTILSTSLLAACALLLNREARVFRDPGLLIMLFFVFPPVSLDLMQGHDVAILLLVYTGVYVALRHNRMFQAGAVLALGLFKPHLILPAFVVLFVANRSWKFLGGFAAVGSLLGMISLAISGWHALLAYPRFVIELSHFRLAGYSPAAMANWRGLLSLWLPASLGTTVLLIAGSLVLLWLGIKGWKYSSPNSESPAADFDLAFSHTVLVTLLVSYHLSPHDLSLLLVPIALTFRHLRQCSVRRDPVRIILACVLVILFLPPLHILALIHHAYSWLALPTLIFFLALSSELRRGTATSEHALQRRPS